MSLNVTCWIDRHLAFLRRKKFRHYRTQWGPPGPTMAEIGGFKNWLTYLRVRGLRAERKAEARPKFVRWLAREWRLTTHATLARMRGDTIVFEIGTPFLMSECIWICTDVGTRTICAVKLDELIESGDSGPPYSIVEDVFDGYDMGGCQLIR